MTTGSALSLRDEVARATTLAEALRCFVRSGESPSGVLRIIAGRVNGRLSIKDGRTIVGALITSSAETGERALEKLLLISTGVFQFRQVDDPAELLSQQLAVDITTFPGVVKELKEKKGEGSARDGVSPGGATPGTAEIFQAGMAETLPAPVLPLEEESKPADAGSEAAQPAVAAESLSLPLSEGPCLSDEQMKLLDLYRKLSSDQDREAFLSENEGFGAMMREQALSAGQLQLLELYKRLTTDRDRQEFLEGNPGFLENMEDRALTPAQKAMMTDIRNAAVDRTIQAFLAFQSQAPGEELPPVSEEQLSMLRQMYGDLATEAERQAFLAQHPGFGELMSEHNLSAEQRQALDQAGAGAAVADMEAFVAFQNQMLGDDHPPLNEQQLQILLGMYRDMAGEANRQAFLAENPVLSDEIPVLRGDQVPLEPQQMEAGPDLEAEARRLKEQLDAINLQAVDMPTGLEGISEAEKPYHEQIGLEKPKKKKKFVEKWGKWAAVFIVTGVSGCLLVLYWARKDEPKPVVVPVLEEGDTDLLGEHLDVSLQTEVPSTIRSRPSQGGGGGGGGGGGYGSAPSYNAAETAYQSVGAEMQAAERLLSEGKRPQAIAVFAACIRSNPDYIPARIALIKVYITMKDHRKARLVAIAGLKRVRTREDRETLQALLSSVLSDPEQTKNPAAPGG